MASLVGGECATDNGAVEEASPALTAQQTEQAEQQWKLAQFRMLRMEAEYNACIAAEGKLGANVVEDSGNDAKEGRKFVCNWRFPSLERLFTNTFQLKFPRFFVDCILDNKPAKVRLSQPFASFAGHFSSPVSRDAYLGSFDY